MGHKVRKIAARTLRAVESERVPARANLQFRVQSVNFTNTGHFSNPDANCGSFAVATSTAPAIPCNRSSFGQVTGVSNIIARENSNGARLIEFNLRLNF